MGWGGGRSAYVTDKPSQLENADRWLTLSEVAARERACSSCGGRCEVRAAIGSVARRTAIGGGRREKKVGRRRTRTKVE